MSRHTLQTLTKLWEGSIFMKKTITMIIFIIFIVSNHIIGFAADMVNKNFDRLISYGFATNDMDRNVSRMEFTELLFNIMDIQPFKSQLSIFEDVKDTEQQGYLLEGYRLGIVCGIEKDDKRYFEPDRKITWGEAIAFVVRCVAISPPSNIRDCVKYAQENGLIENKDFNIGGVIDRKDCYRMFDKLLDFNSCFSYKYSTNKIINNVDFAVYRLDNPFREQQNITYDQIHEYREQLIKKEFNLVDINEQFLLKEFIDYSFNIDEYVNFGSFFDEESFYIERDEFSKNNWDKNDIAELYVRYIPKFDEYISKTDQKYHLQAIHNPDSGAWVVGGFNLDPYTHTFIPILVCYDNSKDVMIYQCYLPKN